MMEKFTPEMQRKIAPVLKEAGVKKSAVFGSAARGEMRADSDIDILVELPSGKSLFDLVALQRKLEEALGRKVDLLTFRSVHPLLKEHIERELVEIL